MKKLLYILLLSSIMCACGDEEGMLEPQMQFENLYTIVDDPDDAIKHRVYEIYEKYDVPVYFNDTIGKILVKTDVNGNPYYRDETLDLAWNFNSYDKNVTYEYTYCIDPVEQQNMLDAIVYYLENSAKTLYPYAFFVCRNVSTVDKKTDKVTKWEGKYNLNNFRTITLMTENWSSEDNIEDVMTEMKRSYVINKISNFTAEMETFRSTSSANWYGIRWFEADVWEVPSMIDTSRVVITTGEYTCYYTSINGISMEEAGFGNGELADGTIMDALFNDKYPEDLTDEQKQIISNAGHYLTGTLGFISYGTIIRGNKAKQITLTPIDASEDLQDFVSKVLTTPYAEFRDEWGNYPRVMDKYKLLYRLISEELDIELF